MSRHLAKRVEEISKEFARKNEVKLRMIANRTLSQAVLSNDMILAEIALIAYCLHKLSVKEHVVKNPKWKIARQQILSNLSSAAYAVKGEDLRPFVRQLDFTVTRIEAIDTRLGHFAVNLFDRARVKLASDAYSLGLSLSRAAELTGCDKRKLQEYIGITKMHDEEGETFGIGERLDSLETALAGAQ
ncbi:MAG: hypothetical protein HY394_04895 [Candidatus Diapherotrites archaeon]|nr:hypothetical protein [Candidatus Diapherotrites archaeon]